MTGAGRFDDLVRGRGLVFPAPDVAVRADRIAEVGGALAEVERQCARGAWAYGFVSYEAAPAFDPGLVTHPPEPGLPLVWFGVGGPPERAAPVAAVGPGYRVGAWRAEWDAEEHRARVERVRERIAAGVTYQCNLTTRLSAEWDGDPRGLYAELAHAQHGGLCAYVDSGRHVVASASPELFFELRGDRIRMRPMKGTARRGRSVGEDAVRAAALRGDPKERAENIMIVDLLRNDLGRIARVGSVRASRLCRVERFDTVLQLTSRVDALLVGGCCLSDVFGAVFPCGSVTGAPKAATMRLIRELECGPRGVYCGAIGYVGAGRARFSVGIRTVVADRSTGRAAYGTGGGITWSSSAAAEFSEIQLKAAILPRHRVGVPRLNPRE